MTDIEIVCDVYRCVCVTDKYVNSEKILDLFVYYYISKITVYP